MGKIIDNLLRPYQWLEKWSTHKHTVPLFLFISIFFALSALCDYRWNFPYFYLFFASFTVVQVAALFSEIRYTKQINKVRALTAGREGFRKANSMYLRFERTIWVGVIAFLIVIIFGCGGLSMFGAVDISPTLILCLIYFSITVYLSIVGYVQYILLLVYIVQIGIDREKYKHISDLVSNKLPAEVDWLKSLTSLSHFYRAIFFTIGAFYIIAFWFYCTAPGFMASTSHLAYFILWGIIFFAIVVTFPIVSLIEFYQIKKIVKKIKTSYLIEIKRNLARNTEREKTSVERTILNQLFSTSILSSSDYPIKNTLGIVYAYSLALINEMGSLVTLLQLGDRFLS